MEQLLRACHAIDRGAGAGGFVICAETSPQDIGTHLDLLKKPECDVELVYWKQASGSNNKGIQGKHSLVIWMLTKFDGLKIKQ